MFFDYFPPRFLKEVAICNAELIFLMFLYNLLVYLIPLVRLTFANAIIILLVTNIVLWGLKFIHAQFNQ